MHRGEQNLSNAYSLEISLEWRECVDFCGDAVFTRERKAWFSRGRRRAHFTVFGRDNSGQVGIIGYNRVRPDSRDSGPPKWIGTSL